MNYLIHATPVHPSLNLQYLILLFTIDTVTVFTLLLLLLFYYCHHYKTVATDKPLWASLFPGAAELTNHLLRLINILWLPLCRINKFGFYFPRRLLRSPIVVGHQSTTGFVLPRDRKILWSHSVRLHPMLQHVTRSQDGISWERVNGNIGNEIELGMVIPTIKSWILQVS
jgi:hypothetical protein